MALTALTIFLAFLVGVGSYYIARTIIDSRRLEAGGLSREDFIEDDAEENRHLLNYMISGLAMVISSMLTFNLVRPLGWTDYYSLLIDAAILVFLAVGISLSWIDFELKLLPTKLIYIGGGITLALLIGAAAVSNNWSLLIPLAMGGALYFLFYFLIWFWKPGAFGYGDVRLSFFIGATLAFLSPSAAFVGFAAAWILALVGIGIGATFGMIGKKTQIAFGPWMVLGAVVGLFWGAPIVTMLSI